MKTILFLFLTTCLVSADIKTLVAEKNYVEAYKELQKNKPSTDSDKILAASVLIEMGQYKECIDTLNTVDESKLATADLFSMRFLKARWNYIMAKFEDSSNILKQINQMDLNNVSKLKALLLQAALHSTLAKFDEAAASLKKAAIIAEVDPSMKTAVLADTASLKQQIGQYAEALKLFKQAAELQREKKSKFNSESVSLNHSLATQLRLAARFKEAFNIAIDELEKIISTYGHKHPLVADSKLLLGNLYKDVGNYKLAESYLREALELRKKTFGDSHPGTAEAMNSLAILLKIYGYLEQAEPLYRKAAKITEKTFGQRHPASAICYNNLGDLETFKGNYKEAELLYKKARVFLQSSVGQTTQFLLFS